MLPSLNPVQLLADYASCNKTGCLYIQSHTIQWRIFFQNGELQYADHSGMNIADLQYFGLKNNWTKALEELKNLKPQVRETEITETGKNRNELDEILTQACQHQILDFETLTQLIKDISQDALESFLWLREGTSNWQEKHPLPMWLQSSPSELVSLNLSQLTSLLQQRIREWQNSSNLLSSPHQRPYFLDFHDVQRAGETGPLSGEALAQLAKLMMRKLSVRQLSLYIKQDEIHIAKLLSPYINQKIIHLRDPNPPYNQLPQIPRESSTQATELSKKKNAYKIFCIDDSPTMLSEMKRFLTGDQYQVTTIDDPVKASGEIFKLKPDLILMDITMPRINGYNLCSLLRSSHVFDDTPIIMVSGNTGLIDKARAKICGATGYLTKPFNREELLSIIDKHLP